MSSFTFTMIGCRTATTEVTNKVIMVGITYSSLWHDKWRYRTEIDPRLRPGDIAEVGDDEIEVASSTTASTRVGSKWRWSRRRRTDYFLRVSSRILSRVALPPHQTITPPMAMEMRPPKLRAKNAITPMRSIRPPISWRHPAAGLVSTANLYYFFSQTIFCTTSSSKKTLWILFLSSDS